MALYVIAYRLRTYVAGFLRERMPVLRFWSPVAESPSYCCVQSGERGTRVWSEQLLLRGDGTSRRRRPWIPAFAGMTSVDPGFVGMTSVGRVVLAALVCACSNGTPRRTATATDTTRVASSTEVRDDFGRVISFTAAPRRVVSLNPTTTETIFAIGAGARLIGRSHWDEWPVAAKAVPDMGNGIGPNVEQIVAAHPDLVLLYASEDNRPAAERLESAGIRTLSLRIDRVADFDRSIRLLGRVLGDSATAALVADSVNASLHRVERATNGLHHPSVVWPLIDASPMVVGGGSFMNELLNFAGARNIYSDLKQPSPLVSLEDVAARNPDFVIRGGEGGSTAPLAGAWRAVPAIALGHVITVPLKLILRPSVQMGSAAAILARALHPGLVLP